MIIIITAFHTSKHQSKLNTTVWGKMNLNYRAHEAASFSSQQRPWFVPVRMMDRGTRKRKGLSGVVPLRPAPILCRRGDELNKPDLEANELVRQIENEKQKRMRLEWLVQEILVEKEGLLKKEQERCRMLQQTLMEAAAQQQWQQECNSFDVNSRPEQESFVVGTATNQREHAAADPNRLSYEDVLHFLMEGNNNNHNHPQQQQQLAQGEPSMCIERSTTTTTTQTASYSIEAANLQVQNQGGSSSGGSGFSGEFSVADFLLLDEELCALDANVFGSLSALTRRGNESPADEAELEAQQNLALRIKDNNNINNNVFSSFNNNNNTWPSV